MPKDNTTKPTTAQVQAENASSNQPENADKVYADPTPDQLAEARQKGVLDAVRESAKGAYLRNDDAGLGPQEPGIVVDHDVFSLRGLLDGSAESLKAAVKEDATPAISEGKVAGVLEMERSGKNRTEYVKVLCDRLGVKKPTDVTDAGPPFTNDTTSLNHF